MIRRVFFLIAFLSPLILMLFVPLSIQAQGRIKHVVTSENQSAPPNGRDYWFGIPQNFDRTQFGVVYSFYIFISSLRSTTVYIQDPTLGLITKTIQANQTLTLSSTRGEISASQVESSGLVERQKAFHVWSNDADLSVYFLSRALQTTDGMYCIPTIGLGTEYIVGSYNAYPIAKPELPSEFMIVSNQDNTYVTITPTADIHKEGFSTTVEHPKDQTFTIKLDKGELVQYQTTSPGVEGSDLTGTYITSTNPVGVIGASVCPNIPVSDPSCDHILDMLTPIRTWGKTYYTMPFGGRKYGGDLFLVLGTKPNQVIKRNGVLAATLNNAHDFAFIYDIDQPSQWTSDTSFSLIQYIESSTHAAPSINSRNTGDPSMVVVNAAEQFGKKTIFQIPKNLATGQPTFTNYLNIILPTSHESKTTLDGKPLTSPPTGLIFGGSVGQTTVSGRRPIPGTSWEGIFLSSNLTNPAGAEGTHILVSDTNVGVYLYGYSKDDSYAWAGALGVRSPTTLDTLAPIAKPAGVCFCAKVPVTDNRPIDTKLNSIYPDSTYNMVFYLDTAFVQGGGILDSSYYEVCVIDSSRPAYISVTVTDVAGNSTTIVSTYEPPLLQYHPVVVDFGSGQIGIPGFQYDTICNTGTADFIFTKAGVSLLDIGKGFSIDSFGADGVIPPGGCRIIKLSYTPKVGSTATTTILFNDGCILLDQPLVGNGGSADFVVRPYDFGCVKPGVTASTNPSKPYNIQNNSKFNLDVDTIWVEDPVHFGYNIATAGNSLPVAVPNLNVQSGKVAVTFTFSPATTTSYKTAAHFLDKKDGIEHIDTLYGQGCAPSITSIDQSVVSDCDIPVAARISFKNIGQQSDSLLKIVSSDTNFFSLPVLDDGVGNQITLPTKFDIDQTIYASVLFTPPDSTSGCFKDTIYLIHPNGDTAAQAIVSACAIYRSYDITQGYFDFGAVPFGNPKVQNSFQLCSTGDDQLTVTGLDPDPTNDGQIKLTGVYKVNGTTVPNLPIILKKGECLDFFAEFDPSISLGTAQTAKFNVSTNACRDANRTTSADGETTSGSPLIQGFTLPAMLSCSARDSFVYINNTGLVTKTIDSAWIDGADAGKFTLKQTFPVQVLSGNKGPIRIGFDPNGGLGPNNYVATVHVIVIDGTRRDTLSVVIGGATNNLSLGLTSAFSKTGLHFGDNAPLDINLKLNKNGLSDPLSSLDIRTVILSYTYDIDLLDITDITKAFTSTPGWVVDPVASTLPTTANPQLRIVLHRVTPLSDADVTLGTINFTATLPRTTPSSLMTLTELVLLDSTADTVRSCLVTTHIDTSITVIYQCGDSTLFKFMNGGGVSFGIEPAVPNPVTNEHRSATLRYMLRHEASVSLSIFDPLGNRIEVLEDNIHHPAGSFEVYYDTKALPSGSYVYRFTFDGKDVRSGRLVIER